MPSARKHNCKCKTNILAITWGESVYIRKINYFSNIIRMKVIKQTLDVLKKFSLKKSIHIIFMEFLFVLSWNLAICVHWIFILNISEKILLAVNLWRHNSSILIVTCYLICREQAWEGKTQTSVKNSKLASTGAVAIYTTIWNDLHGFEWGIWLLKCGISDFLSIIIQSLKFLKVNIARH